MKAILDSWLKVQAAWLYLEPIFGSADIRQQIPTEGKMFEEVDAHWLVNESLLANWMPMKMSRKINKFDGSEPNYYLQYFKKFVFFAC